MKTYRIQIYTNRISADLSPYLTAMFQYYKEHGVTLNYDITPVNVSGYQSVQGQMAYGGNTVQVLRGQEKLVPKTDHDIVMFVFDLLEWKAPWYWPFPLRWDSPRNDCFQVNGKPFISIGLFAGDSDGNQMAFYHEPMHSLAEIFGCPDQMDTYFKNNIKQFKDADSNFSKQWAIFQPYLSLTSTTPVNVAVSPATGTLLPDVTLTRLSDNGVETQGKLTAVLNGKTFSCDTLELPWKDNQHDISCIPKGTYKVSVQPYHKTKMYELQGTAPRTGIFIHPGNYYTDILGCILLGVKPSDINHDGQIDVTQSVLTVKAFMDFMGKTPFTLTIK